MTELTCPRPAHRAVCLWHAPGKALLCDLFVPPSAVPYCSQGLEGGDECHESKGLGLASSAMGFILVFHEHQEASFVRTPSPDQESQTSHTLPSSHAPSPVETGAAHTAHVYHPHRARRISTRRKATPNFLFPQINQPLLTRGLPSPTLGGLLPFWLDPKAGYDVMFRMSRPPFHLDRQSHAMRSVRSDPIYICHLFLTLTRRARLLSWDKRIVLSYQ